MRLLAVLKIKRAESCVLCKVSFSKKLGMVVYILIPNEFQKPL